MDHPPAWYLILFSGIVGAFLGALTTLAGTHFLTIKRETVNRRRIFRVLIRSIKSELEAIKFEPQDGAEFLKCYRVNIGEVRRACCNIAEDFRSSDFENAWVSYCGLSDDDIAQRESHDNVDEVFKSAQPHYDLGRAKLLKLLDALIDCAK